MPGLSSGDASQLNTCSSVCYASLSVTPRKRVNEPTDAATPADSQIMRREGMDWTIVFDGVSCRIRNVRGLQYLSVLLTHPYEDISSLVLERSAPEPVDAAEPMPAHDARERARVNVTRAISTALARIAEHHPALARHLAATIRTGAFCSYTPDPRLPVRWTT